MEIAQGYGAGFMISSFGVNLESPADNREWPATRYPDEACKAMIVDVLSKVEEQGYGWCYDNGYGYFGVVNSVPAYTNAAYEQVEDCPY